MRPTHRVDVNPATPFLQSSLSSLGLASIDSSLYVFYPSTIQVYSQFPHQPRPELSQELLISSRRIGLFAVSNEHIAMVFEDGWLEVRLREHWEVVHCSLLLT
jgi:hypothetical protein